MSASWSDEEDSGSAEWDVLCRVVKRLYGTTRALFLRTVPSDPVYPDLADLMSQWNSDHGVHRTLAQVGEAWSENLDVAEQR
jgi:hypothetical protein